MASATDPAPLPRKLVAVYPKRRPCAARRGRRLRNSRATFIFADSIYAYGLCQWSRHLGSTVLAETPASSATARAPLRSPRPCPTHRPLVSVPPTVLRRSRDPRPSQPGLLPRL